MRVGVTGHRTLAEVERVQRGVDRALDAIGIAFGHEPITLLTPLAEGADRLVTTRIRVRTLGARVIVPLPLPRDEYAKDFRTRDSQAEFTRLLDAAEEVVDLPTASTRGAAYDAVGRYVLEHTDVLLAVWDGRDGTGTGKVVAEARRRTRPIAWIHAGNTDPATGRPVSLGADQGIVTYENFPQAKPSTAPDKPRLVLNVGVTGHLDRDLAGYDVDAIRGTVAQILARLRATALEVHRTHASRFAERPPLFRLFSRLADGSDLMTAEIAVAHRYDLHCPLPLDPQTYETCIAPEWRSRYEAMLRAAGGILELDGAPPPDGTEPSAGAFFESRRMVLRHSDVLIAIWDPDRAPRSSWGTTRLVDEAKHDDLLVVHIDPKKPHEFHLDLRGEDADIHRETPETLEDYICAMLAPPAGAEQMQAYGDFFAERDRRWTIGFAWLAFRNLVFDGWPGRLRIRIAGARERKRSDAAALWEAKPRLPDSVPQAIDEILLTPYAWADTLADHYANLTRSSIVLNYGMAAAAVATALTAHALGWEDHHHSWHGSAVLWTAIEMVLILAIVVTTSTGNRRRWHQRWMDYRVLAERLRLQRTLAPLARITPDARRPAHQSSGDVRETWVGWYFRALARELGMLPGRYDPRYVDKARAIAVKLLRQPKDGQIDWHKGNAQRCESVDHRLHLIGTSLFVATGIACALHLVAHWPWLTFVTASFPACGAALGAIAMHLQLDRIHKHSHAMAERLNHLCTNLEGQPSKSAAIARPCEEIADCMTTEVLDWRSLFRGKLTLPA